MTGSARRKISSAVRPQFWTQVLADARTTGRDLSELSDLVTNYTSITKDDITAALKNYLVDDRFFEVIATPPVKKDEEKKDEDGKEQDTPGGAGADDAGGRTRVGQGNHGGPHPRP